MGKDAYTIIMDSIGKIESARVDRKSFLKRVFENEVDDGKLKDIIENGPIVAGVDKGLLSRLSKDQIGKEKLDATKLSFVSGLPGGAFAVVGLSADMIQYFVNVYQLTQKLLYLYGYDENIFDNNGEVSDKNKNAVLLIQGAMFGVSGASKALVQYLGREATIKALQKKAVKTAAVGAGKKIINKTGINVSTSLAEKIAGKIGVRASMQGAKNMTKIIPVAGGLLSAGITYASFSVMGNRVIKELNSGFDKIKEGAFKELSKNEI